MDNTSQRSKATPTHFTRTMQRSTAIAAGLATVLVSFSLLGRATAPQVPTSTWAATGDMSVGRAGASAVLMYDGRMLVTGGMTDSGVTASAERYSPSSGGFLSTPSVAGGFDGTHALASVDVFNPFDSTVSAGASLGTARAGHSATTLLDGKVLFAGGASDSSELPSAEVYDPSTNTMTQAGGSMAAARQHHHAILLHHNSAVLIVGGTSGGNAVATAEL